MITNIKPNPVPVLIGCEGMLNNKPEGPTGKALLNTFCDFNNDGIPQDEEFHTQVQSFELY